MLIGYLQQLEVAAAKANVRLLDAYIEAGLPDSTYYRHRGGMHEASEKIAVRVLAAIQRLRAKQRAEAARHTA
jgi:hypothetical protein